MRALVVLLFACAPATALAQPSPEDSLPAPWVAHAYPDRFGQAHGLACADDAAFARSWQGPVARLDASGWTALEPVPGPQRVGRALWVNGEGTVLFTSTGDGIARYRDGAWTRFEAPLGYGYSNQIVSFDGETALTVGPSRVVAWSGVRYAAYDPGTWRDLRAIAGSAEDDLWLAGQHGAVSYYDGHTFTSRRIDTRGDVVQLWTPAPDDVWAVTEHPSGVFHWDGAQWSERSPSGERVRVSGVGGSATEVYAVGNFGVVRWRDGRWHDVFRFDFDEYAMPRFRAVCATRTHVVVAEGEGRAWRRALAE